MQTIETLIPTTIDKENLNYNYQPLLTSKLDNLESDFDQSIINEIVLWKVNRYAEIDLETLSLINRIKKTDKYLDLELTKAILQKLLCKEQKGVRLAMASTILRFKNPHIYQIIDQRVFRFLFGKELESTETDISKQIKTYLDYLIKLNEVCRQHNIELADADRIFYTMDKKYNTGINLK